MLLYFLFGILFYQIFVPITDSLVGLICSYFEIKKSEMINKYNEQANTMLEETNAIGFCVEEELEEEYDDDEE